MCGLGNRQPERLESERKRGGVEVAGRHHHAVLGDHERIVRGGVQLDLDGGGSIVDRGKQRAMDRGDAAGR